jgi:hypothetical protein
MTNEQHIENLKKLRSFHNGAYGESVNAAIKALEEKKIKPCTEEYRRVYMKGWTEGRRKLVDAMEREIAI